MVLKDIPGPGQMPDFGERLYPEPRVYTPADFYKTPDGKIHLDIEIESLSGTLPVENVGAASPIWVAYGHVINNPRLGYIGRIGISRRVHDHINPIVGQLGRNEYVVLISPPSDKTTKWATEIVDDLQEVYGNKIRHAPLVGGYDKGEVEQLASGNTVFECDSILARARGVHKYAAATPKQAEIIRAASLAVKIDDFDNLGVTVDTMDKIADDAGLKRSGPIDTFVMGVEAIWGPEYMRVFPSHVHHFFRIPEIVGELPQIHETLQ